MKHKLIFIGNSIVNGFPFSRGKSFPGLIRAAIRDGQAGFHADVINKGANGETTAQILNRFDHDVLAHKPKAVFIMTGTNDFIFREATVDEAFANLKTMAQRATDAGITPVYLTPLPVNVDKASRMWMPGMGIDYVDIQQQIRSFSQMILGSGQICIDTGNLFSEKFAAPKHPSTEENLTASGASAPGDKPATSELSSTEDFWVDGVHPTADGYDFLAREIISWISDHRTQLGL